MYSQTLLYVYAVGYINLFGLVEAFVKVRRRQKFHKNDVHKYFFLSVMMYISIDCTPDKLAFMY